MTSTKHDLSRLSDEQWQIEESHYNEVVELSAVNDDHKGYGGFVILMSHDQVEALLAGRAVLSGVNGEYGLCIVMEPSE